MKKIVFVFIFLITNVQANMRSMVGEYLLNNYLVKQSEVDYKLSLLDVEKLNAGNTFYLNYLGTSIDDKTESSFTYQAIPNKTTNHTFSLSKVFSFGTKVIFEQNIQEYFAKKSIIGLPLASNTTYGAYQKVSLSQDLGQNLFGKSFYLNRNFLKGSANLLKNKYDLTREKGVYEFSTLYLSTSLLKELLNLRIEAVKRSFSRLRLVNRRLRDGLAEKADKWRAESSLLESRSSKDDVKLQLMSSLELLMEKLHRKVNLQDISPLRMKKIKVINKKINNNAELNLYLAKYHLAQIAIDKSKISFLPKLNLSLSYLSNDYAQTTSSDAFSTSILGSNQNSKTIALSLSWPIGNQVEKVELQKSNVSKTQAKLSLEMTRKSLGFRKNQVLRSVKNYNKKVRFQRQRTRLARKTLKELNKLYSKGKVDFDQVIRAEEALIQTESSHYQSVLDYKKSLLNLYFIYGETETNLLAGKI